MSLENLMLEVECFHAHMKVRLNAFIYTPFPVAFGITSRV